MAMLPWDNWFYNLSDRVDEVNNLHSQAVALQENIQNQITIFNKNLADYTYIVAANETLVIISNQIKMTDLLYKDFQVELEALPTPATGIVPIEIGQLITEAVGGDLMIRGLVQFRKIAKAWCSGSAEEGTEAIGEAAAEEMSEVGAEVGIESSVEVGSEITAETVGEGVAEGAAETVMEGASLSSLAWTGVAIFAAVGIDMIFGAINGATERDQLDETIGKLNTAVSKSQTYYNTVMSKMTEIDEGIVKEEKRFVGILGSLANISGNKPTFKYDYDPTVANSASFKVAQTASLTQYGFYIQMRDKWPLAVARKAEITKGEFIDDFLIFAPTGITKEILNQYWDILAKYSDSMKVGGSQGIMKKVIMPI